MGWEGEFGVVRTPADIRPKLKLERCVKSRVYSDETCGRQGRSVAPKKYAHTKCAAGDRGKDIPWSSYTYSEWPAKTTNQGLS